MMYVCVSMIFIFIQDVCVWLYDIYIHTGCMCVVLYLYSYRMYVCSSMIFIFIQDVCVWQCDIYIHTGCMFVVV